MATNTHQERAATARQGENDWIRDAAACDARKAAWEAPVAAADCLPLTYRYPRSHTQAFPRHTDYTSSVECMRPAARVDRWVAVLAVMLLAVAAAAILCKW